MNHDKNDIRAIVLVDHGSKRGGANELLNQVCCTINRSLGASACTHCPNGDTLAGALSPRDPAAPKIATPAAPDLSHFTFCEVAHMELAPPDIPAAVAACVKRGARNIVVLPYFLAHGRHSLEDIPRMAREAVAEYEGVEVSVAPPLGFDDRLVALALERAAQTLPK